MEFIMQPLLPCLSAGAACVAFTFVFNIHGWGKLICGAGGALGWLVYLLCGQSIPAAFLAAVSISLFSEVMARVRRCPVTGYLLGALLPLVPGGGIYYAMRYCVAGETQAFLDMLLHTLGMAAALAAGGILASSAFRGALLHISRMRRSKIASPQNDDNFFCRP